MDFEYELKEKHNACLSLLEDQIKTIVTVAINEAIKIRNR